MTQMNVYLDLIFVGIEKAAAEDDDDYGPIQAGNAFMNYLMRLLWFYGQQVSPADVVRDVEALIQQDEESEATQKRAA